MPKLLVLPKISVIIFENFGFIRFTVDGRYLLPGTRHLESGKFRSAPKISVLMRYLMHQVPSIMYCKTYKTEIFGADRNFPDSRCWVPGSRHLPSTVKRIKLKFSAIMTEIFGKTEIFGQKRY